MNKAVRCLSLASGFARVCLVFVAFAVTTMSQFASAQTLAWRSFAGSQGYAALAPPILSPFACSGSLESIVTSPQGEAYFISEWQGAVTKLSATGAVAWTQQLQRIQLRSIALDPAGDVIVLGRQSVQNGVTITGAVLVLVKLNGQSGQEIWRFTEQWDPSSSLDRGTANAPLAIDSQGNIFIAGVNQIGVNEYEIFFSKHAASSGAVLWTQLDGRGIVRGRGPIRIAIDRNDDPVVAAPFSLPPPLVPNDAARSRIAKFDGITGSSRWEVINGPVSGPGSTVCDLAIDRSNNVVVTGSGFDFVTFKSGIQAHKYDGSNGAALWQTGVTQPASDGDYTIGSRLAFDAGNNVLVAGTTTSDRNFLQVLKYDGITGQTMWDYQLGGGVWQLNALKVDPSGNPVVTSLLNDSGSYKARTLKVSGANGAELFRSDIPSSISTYSDLAVDAVGSMYVHAVTSIPGNANGISSAAVVKYSGVSNTEIWRAQPLPLLSFGVELVGSFPEPMTLDQAGDVVVAAKGTEGLSATGYRTVKFSGVTGEVRWNVARNGQAIGDGEGESGTTVTGLAVDAAGNTFVTGVHPGSIGGIAEFRTIKYANATGAVLWSTTFGAADLNYDASTAIAIDADGDVYVVGVTSSGSAIGMVVVKYSGQSGAQLWTQIYSPMTAGQSSVGGVAIKIDPAGNPVVVATSFEPYEAVNGYLHRVFKLDAATGSIIWNSVYDIGGFSRTVAAIDAAGAIFIAGVVEVNGLRVGKIDGATGTVIWTTSFAPRGSQRLPSLALNNQGDAFVLWDILTGPDSSAQLIKLNGASGATVFSTDFPEKFYSFTPGNFGVVVAPDGHPIVVSSFPDGPVNLRAVGVRTAKYSAVNGGLIWEHRYVDPDNASLPSGIVVRGRNIFVSSITGGRFMLQKLLDRGRSAVDLSGDQKSDLLVQAGANGTVSALLMNGTTVSSNTPILGGGGGWTVTHTADLNGDGKADLLWRNTNGSVVAWLMDGNTLTSATTLIGAQANPNTAWSIIHTGDLNGDGKDDIIWRNADGSIAVWLMNGTSLQSGSGILGANSVWTISHVGDFNGDGKSDILWRHTDGSVAIWLMDGTTVLPGSAGILGPNSIWTANQVADFNGDGKSDILWQNTDGSIAMWLMDSTTVSGGGGIFGTQATNDRWVVTHTGDLNGDGKADLIYRKMGGSGDGTIAAWLMNGTTLLSGGSILGGGGGWQVKQIGDYNGDGKADILFQRASDSRLTIWIMDGLTRTTSGIVQDVPGTIALP
jgi:hypothetical protein